VHSRRAQESWRPPHGHLASGDGRKPEQQRSKHFDLRCTPNVLPFSCERT
jgi:hypothetical protein